MSRENGGRVLSVLLPWAADNLRSSNDGGGGCVGVGLGGVAVLRPRQDGELVFSQTPTGARSVVTNQSKRPVSPSFEELDQFRTLPGSGEQDRERRIIPYRGRVMQPFSGIDSECRAARATAAESTRLWKNNKMLPFR